LQWGLKKRELFVYPFGFCDKLIQLHLADKSGLRNATHKLLKIAVQLI
jgi:hypothetical protein